MVVTAHRRENWGAGLDGIATGVRALAVEHPEVSFIVPMHPNPEVRARWEVLAEVPNVCLTEPAPYAEFAKLLTRSFLVITDSGGIQEEAPSLNKPVLVARETTEREEGVEAGTLRLVGTDPELIFSEASNLIENEQAYREMAEAENPYGDGRAAERIVASLCHLYLGGPNPAQFRSNYSRRAVVKAAGYEMSDILGGGLDPRMVADSERGEGGEGEPIDEIWPDAGAVTEQEAGG